MAVPAPARREEAREATRPLPGTRRGTALTVVVCATLMVSGPAAIFTNNHVMRHIHFGYPLSITALGLGASTTATQLAALLGICTPQRLPAGVYRQWILPVGAFSACTFVLGNASYLFLSVSFIQVLKSLTPVFTLLVTLVDQPRDVTARLALAVMVMTCGGGWAVLKSSPGTCDLCGLTLMLLSDLCEAVRTVAQQALFRRLPSLTLVEALYWYSPVALAFTLAGVAALEVPRMLHDDRASSVPLEHPEAFVMVALLGLSSNILAFWVIQLTSALTLKVLVTISGVLVVVISSLWYGDPLQAQQRVGYSIALQGFAWYQYEKFAGSGKSSSVALQTGSHGPPGADPDRRGSGAHFRRSAMLRQALQALSCCGRRAFRKRILLRGKPMEV